MTTNELTKNVIKYLNLNGHFVSRVNNSGSRGRQHVISKGFPDIAGCSKSGKALFIEIKNAKTKDKLSEAQKEFQHNVNIRDGIYLIVSKFEDIEKAKI